MVFVLWLLACGGEDAPATDSSVTDTTSPTDQPTNTTPTESWWDFEDLAGPCSMDGSDRIGSFEVAHWEYPDLAFSTINGSVASGVLPTAILDPRESGQDCQMFERDYPFCDPSCEAGYVCNDDGDCIPYPSNLALGEVAVEKTSKPPVVMTPDLSNTYWETELPHPFFVPGEPIKLLAEGDEIPGFELRSLGVESLAFEHTDWVIVPGEDLVIDWTTSGWKNRVVFDLNVDQHGTSPVTMICDTEDDGQLVIEASLLDTLLMYGVSGFATATARRQVADSVDLKNGCVEMLTYNHVDGDLTVDGHTACYSDRDCPEGQHCEVAINTCVDD
jgi:hypothetical protein